MESFGETLVHIRKGRGLTQTDIARRMTDLGFSVSTNAVCKWETNYSKPSVLQCFGLCEILSIHDINYKRSLKTKKDIASAMSYKIWVVRGSNPGPTD